LIVPNSELITKTLRNMTLAGPLGRVQIQFAVSLGTDMAKLRALLLELYAAHPGVLDEPAPSVFIDSIASGHVTLNSFAYVGNPRLVYGIRSDLFFSLLQRLADEGIALESPQEVRLLRKEP
jgi:small-conductance mechanosensitive channel